MRITNRLAVILLLAFALASVSAEDAPPPLAEKYLHEHGVLVIPDFIANAGGVICAAMEYHGASQTACMQAIEEKIRRNTNEVLELAKSNNQLPREAAVQLSRSRLEKAMHLKRWRIF